MAATAQLDFTAAEIARVTTGTPVACTGLSPTDAAANRAAIQSQWDDAAAAGNALLIPAGVWPVARGTTVGGMAPVLTPGDPTKRYALLLPPGATLKLADSQCTDAARVQMIAYAEMEAGLYVGWPGPGPGGTIDGNYANQSGWTLGWQQTQAYTAIRADEPLDTATADVVVQNVHITGWKCNAVEIGYLSAAEYGRGGKRVRLDRIRISLCGEGMVVSCMDDVRMTACEMTRHANVAGDDYEPAFCRDVWIVDCRSHWAGATPVRAGGAGVDVYGSRRVVVSGYVGTGLFSGFQSQSDVGDPTNYCDDILVSDSIFDGGILGNGTRAGGNGLQPADGGRTRFVNVTVKNYDLQGVYLLATAAGAGRRAHLQMDACEFIDCGPLCFQAYGGPIRVDLNDVWVAHESFSSPDYHWIVSRVNGASYAFDFNAHGGGAAGDSAQTAGGIDIDGGGTAFAPTGVIRDVSFGPTPVLAFTAGGAGTSLRCHLTGGPVKRVLADAGGASGVAHVGESVAYFDDGGPVNLHTLSPGSIYQELLLTFPFAGGTLLDKDANGDTGNMKLGGANLTVPRYGCVRLLWDSAVSFWVRG